MKWFSIVLLLFSILLSTKFVDANVGTKLVNKRGLGFNIGLISDFEEAYNWKFIRFRNDGIVTHDVVMAIPYTADGKYPIKYRKFFDPTTNTHKTSGNRYRLELLLDTGGVSGDIHLGGTIQTQMTAVSYDVPRGYSIVGDTYMSTKSPSPFDLANTFYSTNKGRFGDGATYWIVGNNCKDYASKTMDTFKTIY